MEEESLEMFVALTNGVNNSPYKSSSPTYSARNPTSKNKIFVPNCAKAIEEFNKNFPEGFTDPLNPTGPKFFLINENNCNVNSYAGSITLKLESKATAGRRRRKKTSKRKSKSNKKRKNTRRRRRY